MFTGIVETMGVVEEVKEFDHSESGGKGFSVTIGDAEVVLPDCHIGDSISTNGVCLTVTEFNKYSFKVGIAPETLDRTNLGKLTKGDKVNLERAVTGSTRLGGHMVQGHVDTVATITDINQDQNSLRMTFEPREVTVLNYIVEKGFIALEGASLTVTDVTDTTFSVMLIAHTQSSITLGSKKVGDIVNVEVDLIGKLIEKQVASQVKRQMEKQTKTGANESKEEPFGAKDILVVTGIAVVGFTIAILMMPYLMRYTLWLLSFNAHAFKVI